MRSRFAVWLIVILSLASMGAVALPFPAGQDVPPITLSEYWERIRSTRQVVGEVDASDSAQVTVVLEEQAEAWEQVRAVEFPDQTIMPVDTSLLVAELRREDVDLPRLKSLLDALLQAHEEYPQDVFTLQDLASLREVLARPEFQWSATQTTTTTVTTPDWLDRILTAIEDAFDWVVTQTIRLLLWGGLPLRIFLVALFSLVVFLVAQGLTRSLVRESQLDDESADAGELLTSQGAIKRAQTLSGQGDYRNAIRYLYLSSLLILDEKGMLRYDRSRTNREVLRSVLSKPGVATPLRDVIDVFDRVWYGFENVDDESYKAYMKHVEELREGEK